MRHTVLDTGQGSTGINLLPSKSFTFYQTIEHVLIAYFNPSSKKRVEKNDVLN
jgi:hypothetical protein